MRQRARRARNVVDNVRGAYVFRNGFEQALRRARIAAGRPGAGAPCVYRWSGDRFELADRRTPPSPVR